MAISSPGLGSNLDVNSIVSQLMALEQAPLTALGRKEASIQAKISALGSLKGTLSSLQSAATALIPGAGVTALQKFTVFKTTVADTTIASASASSSAVAGTYSLEVTQLAQQHRIVSSTASVAPPSVTPFSGAGGTLITGGTLTIRLDTKAGSATPSKLTDVTIADGATPEAVRDAINAANAGVTATVVNGTAGKQLVLVGNTSGSNQFIKLSGIAALAYDPNATPAPETDFFGQTQNAQGSAFLINGIAATAETNNVTTAIDGLTLNLLKQSATGVSTTLTVSRDTSSLTSSLNALVKAYNDFNTSAASLGSYNATTKAAGSLNGDSTLRSAQAILRNTISTVPSSLADASLKRLSDIGISVQPDGSLKLDSSKLNTAITADINAVATLASAYGSAFKTATDGLVGTEGTITARTVGLQSTVKTLTKQAEAVAARLTQVEDRYRKQFTALDTLMARLTKTSSFLSQQLATLPGSRS